mmetsp:Transcript_22621/g.89494  ORF Transcript_22621/g.89494 Transcript_22621/m.89494 type:complete len:302 (-) Transcript_22621:1393-2298(-)
MAPRSPSLPWTPRLRSTFSIMQACSTLLWERLSLAWASFSSSFVSISVLLFASSSSSSSARAISRSTSGMRSLALATSLFFSFTCSAAAAPRAFASLIASVVSSSFAWASFAWSSSIESSLSAMSMIAWISVIFFCLGISSFLATSISWRTVAVLPLRLPWISTSCFSSFFNSSFRVSTDSSAEASSLLAVSSDRWSSFIFLVSFSCVLASVLHLDLWFFTCCFSFALCFSNSSYCCLLASISLCTAACSFVLPENSASIASRMLLYFSWCSKTSFRVLLISSWSFFSWSTCAWWETACSW